MQIHSLASVLINYYGSSSVSFSGKILFSGSYGNSTFYISLLGRENSNSKRYMHPSIHSSTIYNNHDMEWVKNMWYIYTMKYYIAVKIMR